MKQKQSPDTGQNRAELGCFFLQMELSMILDYSNCFALLHIIFFAIPVFVLSRQTPVHSGPLFEALRTSQYFNQCVYVTITALPVVIDLCFDRMTGKLAGKALTLWFVRAWITAATLFLSVIPLAFHFFSPDENSGHLTPEGFILFLWIYRLLFGGALLQALRATYPSWFSPLLSTIMLTCLSLIYADLMCFVNNSGYCWNWMVTY
jgi:hypothetical protein